LRQIRHFSITRAAPVGKRTLPKLTDELVGAAGAGSHKFKFSLQIGLLIIPASHENKVLKIPLNLLQVSLQR
jgi:hypothetical protein